jgi:hypothetical protein
MSPGDESGFASEVHFHIENHVTGNTSVTDRFSDARIKDLESRHHIFHFLFDCVGPQQRVSIPVNFESFANGFGNTYTKLVRPLLITSFHSRDIVISLTKSVGNPPQKAGLWTNLFAMAYSATSTRLDSFRSLSGNQETDPSFQCTDSFHPLMVRCICWLPLQSVT